MCGINYMNCYNNSNAHKGPGIYPDHQPINCQERWVLRDLNQSSCMLERPIECNRNDLADQADLAQDFRYLSQFL